MEKYNIQGDLYLHLYFEFESCDLDLREFLELDSELPKASQTASLSAKNVVKFISKVGERVTNMTIKMEETDEW